MRFCRGVKFNAPAYQADKMSDEILIKDGVKYSLIRPEPETTKFEPMIKEHVKDIFGHIVLFVKR